MADNSKNQEIKNPNSCSITDKYGVEKDIQNIEIYNQERSSIKKLAEQIKFQGLQFSSNEEKANEIYKKILIKERESLPEDIHLRSTMAQRSKINYNPLYKIIQKMPKGAIHHMHIDCSIDPEWYLQLCLNDNVFINDKEGTVHYFKAEQKEGFSKFLDLMKKSGNEEQFKKQFKESLVFSDQIADQKDYQHWPEFTAKIIKSGPLIWYKENWSKYLLQTFESYYNEGVQHIEARCLLGSVIDENGNPVSEEEELNVYRNAKKKFQETHEDFEFLIIAQGLKMWDLKTIEEYLKKSIRLSKAHPDLIRGYDMVQEEDAFKTMHEMAEVFVKKKQFEKEYEATLPFVFHGGESLHLNANENLIDLILLNSKRIGHGVNLAKHSYLMDIIRERKIVIEANPLSNQILNYVKDLRMHPLLTFHNFGIKISLNSDDPGFFGTWYLNYDFFVTTVSCEFDLKDFKKVCLNSLEGSLLPEQSIQKQIKIWEQKWNKFIGEFLKEHDQK